ncbi:MAG: hypothetical protein BWY76_00643 [bacterium ADurb.Bin429]|nr:MAG: hypothetical protein BWY76_00643 [bacterium ADurb.Bin429]
MNMKFDAHSLIWVVIGTIGQIVGYGMTQVSEASLQTAWLFFGFGTLLVIIGLAVYARKRGYHPALALLGLLGVIGYIILTLLTEKRVYSDTEQREQVAQHLLVRANTLRIGNKLTEAISLMEVVVRDYADTRYAEEARQRLDELHRVNR